jgi:hypothetical protein
MACAHIHRICRSGRALCILSATLLGAPGFAIAQEAAAPPTPAAGSRAIPRPDELEPGVNTTATTPAPAAAATAAPAAATAGPATERSPAKTAPARQAAASKETPRKGADRLELDATDITGNRELPKVLYIVPWKRSDLGDVVGRPVNSLLDEVLQPLDRDVFQRENRYYDALKPGTGDEKPGADQGSKTKP